MPNFFDFDRHINLEDLSTQSIDNRSRDVTYVPSPPASEDSMPTEEYEQLVDELIRHLDIDLR